MVSRKKFISLLLALFLSLISITGIFAEELLDHVKCPSCGEHSIVILDDEYGACQCESCGDFFIIVNGKVRLLDGTMIDLSDIFDIEELIKEIEEEYERENKKKEKDEEELDDEDEEESYYEIIYDENDKEELPSSRNDSDSDGGNIYSAGYEREYKNAWEEVKYLYNKDFTTYEPETDEEILEMIAKKKYKAPAKATKNETDKATKEASTSEIDVISTRSEVFKNISKINHVVRYHDGYSDASYNEVIFNSVEFKVRDGLEREGYKFVCWGIGKSKRMRVYPGNPLIYYNFDKEGNPKAAIYDFYAIWEKNE